MSNITAGIELGITNSRIAIFKNGKSIIVPNSMGDPSTPSIVAFFANKTIIGEETMMHKIEEKDIITDIKRLIGKNLNDLKDLKGINYKISGDSVKLKIKINQKGKEETYSPEQIVSLIFTKLIKNATDFNENPITKAVITIPEYFNDKQKKGIEQATKMAGIEILEIIKEPISAAFGYGFGIQENIKDSFLPNIMNNNNSNIKNVLVFHLGGGTLEVSILIIENNEIKIKANLFDKYLGGNDFDNKLMDFCIKDFCQKMNIDINNVKQDMDALKRLKTQCEKGKKKLNKNFSTIINVYNFYEGNDLYLQINRERFDEECEDLYQRIENILNQILIDSGFKGSDIHDVILVGGSSKIPKIKEILEKKFDKETIRDKINPDEVIVMGAAWKANKLIKKQKNTNKSNILPFSLGIGMISKIKDERKIGQLMSVLIPKNSELPKKSDIKRFKTIKDNQSHFTIKVYLGEEKYVKDNKYIGEFKINDIPPGKAKSVSFNIFFEIDINLTLIINAEIEQNEKKVTKKFSLCNDGDKNNNQNITTNIKLNTNPESRTKLNEIRNIARNITNKNNDLNNLENNEDKIKYLNELSNYCSKIINIYENLKKENDSEKFYEKIFDYTKLLFNYCSQIIIIDKEDNSNLIAKIKEEMPKFKNDNIENLLDSFSELKIENPKKYIEIILFCVEMLYKEGDKILEERKKYQRYYSKKFYQKAENIKKYLDEDLIKKMDYKLTSKYKEIEKNYGTKIAEIDSFVNVIKKQIEGKDSPFLPKRTGFTMFHDFITKAEDTHMIIDVYQEMADSLSKGEITEAEAFCRANIIKINFSLFHNCDFKLYDRLNKRIEFIYDRLDIDDEDEPEWHKKLTEINKEIELLKIKLEEQKIKNNELNQKVINNINIIFEEKIKENKPMEFIDYILDNYPYNKLDSLKEEELKKQNFEEVFSTIFPKYHPDNYKDRDDYSIYHEIYTLLVKIEEMFYKK